MIGRELAALLLEHTRADLYLLLHRKGADQDARALLSESLGIVPKEEWLPRMHPLVGGVAGDRLGLPDDAYNSLGEKITSIIHAAAATRFDLPIATARGINVEGTRQVVEFARACRGLRQLGFVSTAFVAGKRTGLIYESELAHQYGFANTYEQSKYEAETLLQAAMETLPIAIYRLSTVLGDSKTGAVRSFTAPHQSLNVMHMGLASLVPGTPDYVVDLIPGDYAARALCLLFTDHFEPGGVYHLTAPPEKSYTLGELLDESYRYLGEHDAHWAKRRYPKPLITSQEAFDLSLLTIRQANNPFMAGILGAVSHFADQLSYPKTFSRKNVAACLPEYDREMPHISEYYGKVVRFCLETRKQKSEKRNQLSETLR